MRTFRIDDPHRPGLHSTDPPRVGTEQEDVADHRLDREVLVHASDGRLVGIGHDPVVAHLGYGSAARDGREASAAPRSQYSVHLVAVQVRHPPAPARDDPLGHEVHHGLEVIMAQLAIRRGSPDELVQLGFVPFAGRGNLGDELLGEDVERSERRVDCVEPPGVHPGEQSCTLDQFVAGEGEQHSLGDAGS